ncbi:MAG: SIS domain-containing protein [Xanthomonadaceae bacterium]|nr:SIS domain-containing protein [Xanthomonadaceae bacterium]
MAETPLEYVKKTHSESLSIQKAFVDQYSSALVNASKLIGDSIRKGGKLLIIGNGGSAADAQHIAAEMVGRMLIERKPLPAIALTTDSSNLTAIGNDYGYDQVFVRQVQAIAKPEDVLLAISTSGNSVNVLKAVEVAKAIGCKIIVLTGGGGGKLLGLGDVKLCVKEGPNSSRIQESHLFALHSLVDVLDRFFI